MSLPVELLDLPVELICGLVAADVSALRQQDITGVLMPQPIADPDAGRYFERPPASKGKGACDVRRYLKSRQPAVFRAVTFNASKQPMLQSAPRPGSIHCQQRQKLRHAAIADVSALPAGHNVVASAVVAPRNEAELERHIEGVPGMHQFLCLALS